jgi:ankyrin repeat protein
MHILQVPTEIFHKILYHCILVRGLARGLRLKLVCKAFYHAVEPALFESRLLDLPNRDLPLDNWYIRRFHPNGADRVFHSYLVYRVKNETDPNVGRFTEIRDIAIRLHTELGADLEKTISVLCWLALERAAVGPGDRLRWMNDVQMLPNQGLNLLSAAAYLNHITLAKRLLQEGHDPAAHNHLFSPPMELAAWAGDTEMLLLFQEHMPEYEALPRPYTWRGKAGPHSVKGAALRGDLNMFHLAIHPPSSTNPKFWIGSTPQENPGKQLHDALLQTRDLAVCQSIKDLFGLFNDIRTATSVLVRHARYGNLDMVRRALDDRANIRGFKDGDNNPLMLAARGAHEDVVDLLLERGADPNYSSIQHLGTPLTAAVAGGSLVIVRKLLDRGARVVQQSSNGCWVAKTVVLRAVSLEHSAILELLLERNAEFDAKLVPCAIKHAQECGLESMVELLQQRYMD